MKAKRITKEALLAGAAIALIGVAQAAEYQLVEGDQYELCRDLERNLNTFKDEPPMVCGIRLNPEFEDFRVPAWEPMRAKDHVGLLKQMYWAKYSGLGGYTPEIIAEEWRKYLPELKQKIERGQVQIAKGHFDIEHDSDKESVVRLRDDGCDAVKYLMAFSPPDPNLFVLSTDGDVLYSGYDRMSRNSSDTFLYKGRTYLSSWGGITTSEDTVLYVYETFEVFGEFGFQLVCRYDYLP